MKLENIWFSYESKHYVLKNINLEISRKITLVKGPNGSGKTTLLKIASLLLRPEKGRVIVDGISYWEANRKTREFLRKKIVYVHERPYLFKGTVFENLTYPLKIRGKSVKHVYEIAKKFRILDILETDVSKLSAGMKQLTALARAFVFKPKYVLLDEPLANLDDKNRGEVIKLIEEYAKEGISIIIAVHGNVSFSKDAVAKIVYLNDGVITKIVQYS